VDGLGFVVPVVPHQATFALLTISRSSSSAACLFSPDDVAADHAGLLAMIGMVGSVERERERSAVNCASIGFNHELFVGVYAISTLFTSVQFGNATALRSQVRSCPHDRQAHSDRVETAQVSARS